MKKLLLLKFIFVFAFQYFCPSSTILAESQVPDPDQSTFSFISRCGEKIRPVSGEKLDGKIILKDKSGKLLGGVSGETIRIFSLQNNKIIKTQLTGETQEGSGKLLTIFEPVDKKYVGPVKISVKVGEIVLTKTIDVEYYKAKSCIDQCQPLWTGREKLYRDKTLGQSFITGNIKKISQIKIMAKKNNLAEDLKLPVLKLFEWKGNYEKTKKSEPLAINGKPLSFDNPRWTKLLIVYHLNCEVQNNTKYYFELSTPDNTGNKQDGYINIWRCRYSQYVSQRPDPYAEGNMFISGVKYPMHDLTFYIFYKN